MTLLVKKNSGMIFILQQMINTYKEIYLEIVEVPKSY